MDGCKLVYLWRESGRHEPLQDAQPQKAGASDEAHNDMADLRRVLDRQVDLRNTPMREVMTLAPRTIEPQALAAEAVNKMEQHGITGLLVVDAAQRLVGALNIHDLLRAGVV